MNNKKHTSKKVASEASKLLKDPKTSKNAKKVAGSALAQAPLKSKKKKSFKLFYSTFSKTTFVA